MKRFNLEEICVTSLKFHDLFFFNLIQVFEQVIAINYKIYYIDKSLNSLENY